VSCTTGLDELEKRETSCPCPIRTRDCPGRNLAININYFSRALNVLIKTPARDFLKTSACCLTPSLLSDLITDSPRRRTCNFDRLLFKRTQTTVFSPYLFHRTIFLRHVCADCIQGLLPRRQWHSIGVFYTRPWTSPQQIRNDRPEMQSV
jgi:hypothetical protein